MLYWVLSIYVAHIIVGGLWFAHLHNKGELISDYPYDVEM